MRNSILTCSIKACGLCTNHLCAFPSLVAGVLGEDSRQS